MSKDEFLQLPWPVLEVWSDIWRVICAEGFSKPVGQEKDARAAAAHLHALASIDRSHTLRQA